MLFRQYHLECLSLFSYLIGDTSTGRAVVVDPQRDVDQYLAEADEAGLRIERVVETHFHADFLSGHLELAAATGATISYGDAARPDFSIEPLGHGQCLALGEVELEIRHTPGHTPESISVVVWEHVGDRTSEDRTPYGVLTGDTLFIGDVGRPDLLASAGRTADDMARDLYRSLHEQLLSLPDETRVFPAHGAGSSCGKQLSTSTESTIGEQRATNYALRTMDEDDFVAAVTEGQAPAPPYFAFAANANRREHALLEGDRPPALSLAAVQQAVTDGALLLDTRSPEVFASGHLRGAVNVGLDGRFAEYVGDIAEPDQPIVVVGEPGRETEARVRLARIGFDTVIGHLADLPRVLSDHPELAATAARVAAADLAAWIAADPDVQVVDVRGRREHDAGMVPGAIPLPLTELKARHAELDPRMPIVVHCAGGYRSSIGASYLRARGYDPVADLLGGYDAWARSTSSSR